MPILKLILILKMKNDKKRDKYLKMSKSLVGVRVGRRNKHSHMLKLVKDFFHFKREKADEWSSAH